MATPVWLDFAAPTKWDDGSPFGQADFVGFTFTVDNAGAVSLPIGWDTDGLYRFDIATVSSLSFGHHSLTMQTVAKQADGQIVTSAPSGVVEFDVDDKRQPLPPFGLAISVG